METQSYVLYVPSPEDKQRPKMSQKFIESFDMVPIFLLQEEEDTIPEDAKAIGLTYDPSFSEEAGGVIGSVFLKDSAIGGYDSVHVHNVEFFIVEGEDLEAEVVECRAAAFTIKPGLSEADRLRQEEIARLKAEIGADE